MDILIDQARSGSFAAPVEIYVRIDEFIGDHTSAEQLLQGTTLPAAILQDAYGELLESDHRTSARRAYFFRIGASVIRRRLTDYANPTAQPPPEDAKPLSSETVDALLAPDASLETLPKASVHAFDAALNQLEADHSLQAQIIECRLFGSMPDAVIATALDQPAAAIEEEDAAARAWLRQHLTDSAA